MNPSILIPTPDSLQVHWGWFKFLLTLTFMAHIILMNTMLGSGMIAFFYSLKRASTNDMDSIQKDISKKLTFTIAFAINFGVAPLLFLQVLYGHFIYVSSVLMAVYWLSIIVLLIIAYYSAYVYKFKFDSLNSNRSLFIGITVVILLFTGFVFTNNMTLMIKPETWGRYFDNPEGTLLNLSDPTLFPRYLHFITASAAIGGLFIAVIGSFKEKKRKQSVGSINIGMKWFSRATLLQLIVGSWFLISLPDNIRSLFIGGSAHHTGIFALSLVGVIFSIIFGFKGKVWPSVWSVLFTILSMIIIRDNIRTCCLEPYFKLSDLNIVPQYSPMIFFFITLVIGIAVIVYMLKLACGAYNMPVNSTTFSKTCLKQRRLF